MEKQQFAIAVGLDLGKNQDKQDASLQRRVDVLVASKAARITAVHRVLSNTGRRSRGLGDPAPTTNAGYLGLVELLRKFIKRPHSYKARPLDRIYIPKGDEKIEVLQPTKGDDPNLREKKLRPLSIPTIIDRCVQALWAIGLEPYAESTADKNSYGFRRGRSQQWAMKAIQTQLVGRGDPQWVLEVDIAKCFDSINHPWLLNNVPFVHKHFLREWLSQGYIIRDFETYGRFDFSAGVPQGGIISPMLCNMALDGAEDFLNAHFHNLVKNSVPGWSIRELGYVRYRKNLSFTKFVRYADDIVVLTKTKAMCEESYRVLNEFLSTRGLALSPQKTRITDLTTTAEPSQKSFVFVGFRFGKYKYRSMDRHKWFVEPPVNKFSALCKKLDTLAKDTSIPIEGFFIKTNEIVRGWVNYYITCNVRRTLKQLGQYLFIKFYFGLVRRLRFKRGMRRSNGRLDKKRMSSYISRIYQGIWHYRGSHMKWFMLKGPKTIRRKVYALYAPQAVRVNTGRKQYYLPGMSSCKASDWEKIVHINMNYRPTYRFRVLKRSNGHCAKCDVGILNTGLAYDLHHILPVSLGGKSNISNLVPLCKDCHYRISSAMSRKDEMVIAEYESQGLINLNPEL